MRRLVNHLPWALCVLLLCSTAQAQLSERERAYLDQLDYASYLDKFVHVNQSSYSFLAAGHWYGAHENSRSQHPASSLYAALDAMKRMEIVGTNRMDADDNKHPVPNEIFALGDVVRDATDSVQVTAYLNLPGQIPTFLLPGNHDLLPDGSIPVLLDQRMPFQYFAEDRFLLLNTESLRFGGGKAMLAQIADSNVAVPQGRNLMVFSHRLLWALTEPGFAEMDDFANEPFAPLVNADTLQMIYQAVLKAAEGGHLHWFSGDVGASWSENVFYGSSADSSRHFYAAGLGDCPEDAFWHVQVDTLGHVDAQVWPLNGSAPKPLAYYGLDQWRSRMQARQPAKTGWLGSIIALLRGYKFWIGFGVGGIVVQLICWAWRRLRRKRAA